MLRRKETRKVIKGARGMPVALGGEEGRDKLRKAAARGKYPLRAADVRMGEPGGGDSVTCPLARGERGELKHLSTHRKRK